MSHTTTYVLQRFAAFLLTASDGIDWSLESFCIRKNAFADPHLTVHGSLNGNAVTLHARPWSTGFRVAVTITHGPCRASAPDGSRAPPERQKEPNVVTKAVELSLSEAEMRAASQAWAPVIIALFEQAKRDLVALAGDISRFLDGPR